MKQIILGTAGHIDHGKTSLIKAVTGINTDRLKEEQIRGITIELGFAHMELPGGERIGIVDVPGHEKFVKNMVAGATEIDMAAMRIAADKGNAMVPAAVRGNPEFVKAVDELSAAIPL